MDRRRWLRLAATTLAAAPLGGLFTRTAVASSTLALRRDRNLHRLQDYIEGGRFPVNHYRDGIQAVLYDERSDIPCAMAALMILDGHREHLLEAARKHNHILIPALHEGPLFEWILYSGLTQEECALIQPSYPWKTRFDPQGNSAEVTLAIAMHLQRVLDFLRTPEQTRSSLALATVRLPSPLD